MADHITTTMIKLGRSTQLGPACICSEGQRMRDLVRHDMLGPFKARTTTAEGLYLSCKEGTSDAALGFCRRALVALGLKAGNRGQ